MIKKAKHLLIKNHDSHKGLIGLTTVVLAIVVVSLFYAMLDVKSITESEFRIIVVVLLITLNIIALVFSTSVIHFLIEVKDKYFDD